MSRAEMGGEHSQRKVKQVFESIKQRHRGKLHISLQCSVSPGQKGCLGVSHGTRFLARAHAPPVGWAGGISCSWLWGGVSLKKLDISGLSLSVLRAGDG